MAVTTGKPANFLTTASGGIHESQCRHAKIESNIGNAARVRANTDDEQAARNQHAHSGLVMTQTRGRDAIFTGANSPWCSNLLTSAARSPSTRPNV